jgi:hypothetical protein
MESDGNTDRAIIRAMVEEHWRAFIEVAQTPEIGARLKRAGGRATPAGG